MTGWVNRFANAGDTAMEVAGNTALRVRINYRIISPQPGRSCTFGLNA